MAAIRPKRYRTNLGKLRRAAGLSQVELGKKCKVASGYIALLEGGYRMPKIDLAGRLAKALETTVEELVFKPLRAA